MRYIQKRRFHFWQILLSIAVVLTACSKDDEATTDEIANDIQTYAVEVIYPSTGLGDLGYNDNIYSGFRECQEKYGNFVLESYIPKNIDETDSLVQHWIDEGKRLDISTAMSKRLLVLVDGTYSELFDKHPEWGNTTNNDILLLDQEESKYDIYSVNLPLYGACYLAGEVVKDFGAKKVACVVANPYLDVINIASDGFIKGYEASGGVFDRDSDIYYLSDDAAGGFAEADSLYHLSYKFAEDGYRFVFTVAGGSSQGVLRYTRQHATEENCFFINGMDVDQQSYSERLTFSVIKKMDQFCIDFMGDWLTNKSIPRHQMLGLQSGYVDVQPATVYEKYVHSFDTQREKAVEAENNFYK